MGRILSVGMKRQKSLVGRARRVIATEAPTPAPIRGKAQNGKNKGNKVGEHVQISLVEGKTKTQERNPSGSL